MTQTRLKAIHHFIRAGILFGFAFYIVQLVKSEDILYYIAPRMVDYVKWSAVGLYAAAVYQLYLFYLSLLNSSKDCDHCNHGHDHAPKSWTRSFSLYGLFIFPLLLGFMLPNTTMGSSLAAKKGMNLTSSASIRSNPTTSDPGLSKPAVPGSMAADEAVSNNSTIDYSPAGVTEETLAAMFPSDKYTEDYAKYARTLYKSGLITVKEDLFIETLTTLDLYMNSFIGSKIELSGFVYREPDMQDKQFVISRFSISCCSADASPYGLLVEYDKAKELPGDTWIKINGTIKKTLFNGLELLTIQAEKLEKVEAPKSAYVYPNPNFGM